MTGWTSGRRSNAVKEERKIVSGCPTLPLQRRVGLFVSYQSNYGKNDLPPNEYPIEMPYRTACPELKGAG